MDINVKNPITHTRPYLLRSVSCSSGGSCNDSGEEHDSDEDFLDISSSAECAELAFDDSA